MPVDWYRVICDLQLAGMSPVQIAKEVQCSRATVYKWREGSAEPMFSKGERLLSIYTSVLPSDPTPRG